MVLCYKIWEYNGGLMASQNSLNNYSLAAFGVGASANTAALYVNLPNRIGLWVTGSNISSGSDADGIFVDTSFAPSSNITNAASIGLYPTMAPPGGVTISNAYGLYIASGTFTGAGAVTTGYGLFVTAPTIATTNITAQLDNIRLDSNTISATNSNGALTVVSDGVGALNIGTNATAHATTIGSTTASATTVIQAPSGGVTLTGVAGTSVSNLNVVTIDTSTGQLGSQAASSGTVTSVSVTSANGFAGTVATATTTPAITISTTITGVLSGNGTAISGSAITQHDVLVGGASNAITSVAPSATSGVPLISQGASSDPAFGTAVVAGGGTGATTLTNHGVLIGQGTSAIVATATGSAGQVLQSGGASANPSYSTATYPSTATGTGTLLRADGTNWVATTSTYPNTNAVSTLLYASSANVMAALATANGGVLTTSSSGVPSIDTTNFSVLSTGVQMKGNNTNTAPPAGFIGEQIKSTIAAGSAVTVNLNTATNITSISLTAGVWDVNTQGLFTPMAAANARIDLSISTTSATLGTDGDNNMFVLSVGALGNVPPLYVVNYRILLSSTTTVYMVGKLTLAGTSTTGYGRISATRVG